MQVSFHLQPYLARPQTQDQHSGFIREKHIRHRAIPHQGYIVDAVVLATTLNEKHTLSLITYLKEDLKPQQEEFVRIDEDENWTVIDLGDILIHLMTSPYREKYQLDNFLAELS